MKTLTAALVTYCAIVAVGWQVGWSQDDATAPVDSGVEWTDVQDWALTAFGHVEEAQFISRRIHDGVSTDWRASADRILAIAVESGEYTRRVAEYLLAYPTEYNYGRAVDMMSTSCLSYADEGDRGELWRAETAESVDSLDVAVEWEFFKSMNGALRLLCIHMGLEIGVIDQAEADAMQRAEAYGSLPWDHGMTEDERTTAMYAAVTSVLSRLSTGSPVVITMLTEQEQGAIRAAATEIGPVSVALDRTDWTVAYASSGTGDAAIDGDSETAWTPDGDYPHQIQIDLATPRMIHEVRLTSTATEAIVYVTGSRHNYGNPVGSGTGTIALDAPEVARYVCVVLTSGTTPASVSGIDLIGRE